MRKSLLILLIAAFFGASLWARPQTPQTQEPEKKRVNIKAETMMNIPGTDSIILVGDVVMYHNGAVITCDSAVRYSDRRIDFFKRVIINKDSTYIYGQMARYDGDDNIAQVFDKLIKVVDGNSTLYTYNFAFNTLDNIGRYWGGGYMEQDSNRLESDRGWYYSDERNIYAAGAVEMTDPEYKMISDSVRYNMDDEIAEFYTLTYIWNQKGEMLSATSGMYFHHLAEYDFTSDAYILTEDQEIWADDIKYNSQTEDALLRRNIQVRDEEQKTMAFGNYGVYWGDKEEGFLTEEPAIVTFDPEQDSLFMRSDTMFVYSIAYDLDYKQYDDSIRRAKEIRRLRAEGLTLDADGKIVSLDSLRMTASDSTRTAESLTEPSHGDRLSSNRWMAEDDPGMKAGLQEILIDQKRGQYEYGDTLTLAILTAPVRDSLLRFGVASEDIEGQLLYNEMKKESADPDKPLDNTQMMEILVKIGMLEPQGNEPQTEGEAVEKIEETVAVEQGGTVAEATVQEAVAETSEGTEEKSVTEEAAVESAPPVEAEQQAAEQGEQVAQASLTAQTATEESSDKAPLTKRERKRLERERKQADKAAARAARNKKSETVEVSEEIKEALRDSLDVGTSPGSEADSLGACDSIQLTADTVPVQHDSLQRIFKGYYNVRIFRNDFQAVCDSMVGFSKDSTMHLYIDPVLWNGQNQITAEVIDIYTKNQEIERAFFSGDPFMVSEVDTTRYNQIKGREMEAFFRNNEIFYHRVKGNAQTLYYMMDDDANEPNAFMVVNSAEIMFVIDNQQVDRITYNVKPDYIIYPIDDIPLDVERFLEGFRWEAHRRPTRQGVFDRPIRPSQRAAYEAIPQPQFPLREKIEKYKFQMIEQRLWEDRIETLPPYALDYIRTLSVQ